MSASVWWWSLHYLHAVARDGDDAGGTAGGCARLSPREPSGLGWLEARARAPRLSACGAQESGSGNSLTSWRLSASVWDPDRSASEKR